MRRALALGTAAILLAASVAEAAPRTRRAARAGLRSSRIDAILPPEVSRAGPVQPGVATPAFTFDLLAPFFFNSNPATLEGSPHPGWEAHPEIRLGWTRRSEAVLPLRWDALIDTSADRFRRGAEANADTLLGRVRAQYESGRDDQEWQPFLSFQPSRDYAPAFRHRLETRHDLAAGVSTQWNLDAAWRRVAPAGDTGPATVWSASVNASLQRRFAAPFPDSWALLVNPGLAWTPTPRLSVSAEAEVSRRFFDRRDGASRRDWLVVPTLTLDYLPSEGALPPSLGSPAVSLQLFLTRQSANQHGLSFTQYGAGPILRSTWRF